MRMISNLIVIVVSAIVGISAGYALKSRHVAYAQNAEGQITGAEAAPFTVKSGVKTARVQYDDSPLTSQLARDLSKSSPLGKWFYWMNALENAQPADFPRLARLARNNPAIWPFVVNRWVETAPRHLFDTLQSLSKYGDDLRVGELGRALFDTWPKQDPEAAIATLNTTENLGMRDMWRIQVATALADNNAERGLELFSQWHIESMSPRMDAINAWAAADPQHAAEFTLAHPSGFASQMAMDAIGKAWAKTDPAVALNFAISQPGDLSSRLATTVMKEWAGQNLEAASDWIAGTDDRIRNRLSPALVEAWAGKDATDALSWSLDNLHGAQLVQAVTSVMNGAAAKNPDAAAAMVAGMEPSQARAEAAGVVAQKLFPAFGSSDPVKPETLSWLTGLDAQSVKRVIDQVSWSWARADSSSMAKFLALAPNDEVPAYADSILARQMVRTTPVAALDWAATLPEARGLTAGAAAFAEWQQSQPDAAMQWLGNLPATDPRRQPFFESMVHSLAYSAQGAEQLSAMSAADQVAAQSVIAKMSLPENTRARLLDSLKPR